MMAPRGVAAPPLGTVIEQADGSHSIWDGKQFSPAAQDSAGNWGIDKNRLATMGLGGGKLSPDDAKTLTEMAQKVRTDQLIASRSQQFIDHMGNVGTGPIYADVPVLNHVIPNLGRLYQNGAQALGASNDAETLGKLDAINHATWMMLRQPGSGQIRQYEANDWKTAFPSTSNYGHVNSDINDRNQHEYREGLKQLQFVQDYVHSGRGGIGDAIAAYTAAQQQPNAAPNPRASANAALKARSAQARGPAVIDINGNPVPQ